MTLSMIEAKSGQGAFTESRSTYSSPFERLVRIGTHDVKECLRMVTTYAGLLRREATQNLDEEQRGYLDYVLEGSNRLNELLDSLSKFARAAAIPIRHSPVPLEGLLRHLQKKWNGGDKVIHWEIATLPTLWADAELTSDLLERLLSNCVKFAAQDRELKISISGKETDAATFFRVTDNGIGIAEEYLAHLFEPFRRVHSRKDFPGVGLGLAYCREIVDLHQGKISVESTVGQGTTIEVEFPKQPSA